MEDELALLDDESRRLTDGYQPSTTIPGFGLLPALELLAKKQAKMPTRHLYSVVPDPPSAVMLKSNVKVINTAITPKIIATADNNEPCSPIPPESPSVSEVAIEWYTTPVSDKTNNKRFRIPSDAAQACGSPEVKYGAPASCRSSTVTSEGTQEEESEDVTVQQSEYDSDEVDEEKRASFMTVTFGPPGHITGCKTGRCSINSVPSVDEQDESDTSTDDDESRDYVSAIPLPVLRKSPSADEHDSEEMDILDASVRLS